MTTANMQTAFSKQSSITTRRFIQKGQQNKYRLRPSVLNEHVESARKVQAMIDASTIVGQIFKLNEDNINGATLTMESAAGVLVDNFESYATSVELQAAWVETDEVALLETVLAAPANDSTQSMKMPGDTIGAEWVRTLTSADYTDFDASFWFRQTIPYSQQKMRIFIGDGTNTKSFPIVMPDINTWFEFNINEQAFTEDDGTTDITAITKVGIRVEGAHPNSFAYLDEGFAVPAPGSVDVKLWDMGDALPESGVMGLSDGEQYITLGDAGFEFNLLNQINVHLLGGKREYYIEDFVAGPAFEIPSNVPLTPGNYYAITIHHVDTDISVYGPDISFEQDYYRSGYAFTAPDEVDPIVQIGAFSNLQFLIFSTQEAYINRIVRRYDSTPGSNSKENVRVEGMDMDIVDVLIQGAQATQENVIDFTERVFYTPKGGKFEINHNDDYTDLTTFVELTIGFIVKPPIVNG